MIEIQNRISPMSLRRELGYNSRYCSPGVAIMEIGDWLNSGNSHNEFLSLRERRRLRKFNRKDRKSEWLASRLVAKYLFLSQLERNGGSSNQGSWSPTFRELTPVDLNDFPLKQYREIEILPQRNPEAGPARLVWCDDDFSDSIRISISYAGGWTGAFISSSGWIGIDLEEVVPRSDPFYRRCFSEMERHWVREGVQKNRINVDWLYTLLWTLKECCMKSGQLEGGNIWHANKIEINILTPLSDLLNINNGQLSTDGLTRLDAQVAGVNPRFTTDVAYVALGKLILSVLNVTK